MNKQRQIVPGITVSQSGQATIDPSLKDILFDLALNLEAPTGLPVDIEHVVAAIVLATRADELDANTPIVADDKTMISVLTPHVKSVFARYGGNVGDDGLKDKVWIELGNLSLLTVRATGEKRMTWTRGFSNPTIHDCVLSWLRDFQTRRC